MNRRNLLLTGFTAVIAAPAYAQGESSDHIPAQGESFDQIPDEAPVKGLEELWYLVTAMDTLIFVMAVLVLEQPETILRTRMEFQRYGAQLASPDAVEILNLSLVSPEGQRRVKEGRPSVEAASEKLNGLLRNAVSERLHSHLRKSFSRTSTLLNARSPENEDWWCHCYGLRKLCS